MGLYATLLDAELPCPRCGKSIVNDWQFYFGTVTQLAEYRLGDTIAWDEPARFGDPTMNHVYALAYSVNEPACPSCPVQSIIAEILIEDQVIRRIVSPRDCAHLPELLYEGSVRKPRFYDDLYCTGAIRIAPPPERR